MAKGDDIEERLIAFAVSIIQLITKLPNNDVGVHIRKQLIRSGTAPAANYAEARNAESPRDFVHKMRISMKEMNELFVWLKIIKRAELVNDPLLHSTLSEADELCRILNASIQTAKKRITN